MAQCVGPCVNTSLPLIFVANLAFFKKRTKNDREKEPTIPAQTGSIGGRPCDRKSTLRVDTSGSKSCGVTSDQGRHEAKYLAYGQGARRACTAVLASGSMYLGVFVSDTT